MGEGGADDVIVPPDALYFGALGALAAGPELARVEQARAGLSRAGQRLSLMSDRTEVRGVRAGLTEEPIDAGPCSDAHAVTPPALAGPRGSLALGLDAGSTTVKAVVLDSSGAVRASIYRRAHKGPLEDAKEVLSALERELGPLTAHIDAFGVTGYATRSRGVVTAEKSTLRSSSARVAVLKGALRTM